MADARELSGKVALVTGGARNIGRAISLALADWQRVLSVIFDGAFVCAQACLRHMSRADGGGFMA